MSTPVVAVCPHCEKKIKVKNPDLIGKKVKCPGCTQPFVLEAEEETYSLSSPAPEPKPASSSPHDEWLSALGAAAESERSQASTQPGGGLPPLAGQSKPKKKKKREFGPEAVPGSDDDDRYGYGVEESMGLGLAGAVIGGLVAGVIGALVWGGISYTTGYEVGYVAWGIGALVGFGVLLGAREHAGVSTGVLALVMANLSIFAGKVFAVWMLLAGMFHQFDVGVETDFVATDSYVISEIAGEIADKRVAAGEQIAWPRDDMETFDFSVDYPPEVWQQAEARWNKMSPAEKAAYKLEIEAEPDDSESYLISFIADEILYDGDEWEDYLEEADYDYSVDYPADIWAEAEAQWNALSPEQKQARKDEVEADFEDFNLMEEAGLSLIQITWNTLVPLDGLWILLASFTAFRIGANEHGDD